MNRFNPHLRSWLRTATAHVNAGARYRWYPVYSALLALIVIMTLYWPTPEAYWYILMDHPGLITLIRTADAGALGLAIAFGLVGLLRQGWMPKAISVFGLWWGARLTLSWINLPSAQDVWLDFTWYAFELPTAGFTLWANGDQGVLTCFYALYLLAIYFLIRPVLKVIRVRVGRFQAVLLERYPTLSRWAEPIV